jgi:predicted transcriptional regulator
MADDSGVPKRHRTDGLDSETTVSLKVTQHMKDQLTAVAQGMDVSNSEVIRLAVIAFIKERIGQYDER